MNFVGFVLILSACAVDARVGEQISGSQSSVEKRADISPTLVPESDSKFFGKDYPFDKRPSADHLHFKHPYPAVQDSGDYDADYVKDENSDNGEFAAQTEYDRLRHKLAQEKKDAAKALEAKERAEKELQEALRHDKEMKDRKAAADEAKRVAEKHRKDHEAHGTGESERTEKAESPGGAASSGEVEAATADTENRMKKLEDCRKELAAAREKLKKLMDELDEARKREKGADADLQTADEKARLADAAHGDAMKGANSKYKDHMDAKGAYMKQKAIVDKMEKDIEVLGEKVRAYRAKEDADGGVYPTPTDQKSAAKSLTAPALSVVSTFCSFFLLF